MRLCLTGAGLVLYGGGMNNDTSYHSPLSNWAEADEAAAAADAAFEAESDALTEANALAFETAEQSAAQQADVAAFEVVDTAPVEGPGYFIRTAAAQVILPGFETVTDAVAWWHHSGHGGDYLDGTDTLLVDLALNPPTTDRLLTWDGWWLNRNTEARRQAELEGWWISNNSDGELEIQCVDGRGTWLTDEEAERWVRARAWKGSQLHIDALGVVTRDRLEAQS